jgi:uncharacterized protein YecT (DUF1311 family)
MFRSLITSLMLLVGAPSIVTAASFDCDRASTEAEIAICSDPELSALDTRLGELWMALDPSQSQIDEQRAWLEKRDYYNITPTCIWNIDQESSFNRCLRDHYRYRIYELVTNCSIDLKLNEIRDEYFPENELQAIINASETFEGCVDKLLASHEEDFETVSLILETLNGALGCSISTDPFMYPVAERIGHWFFARCNDSAIYRHGVLLNSITEKNNGMPAALAVDQSNWESYNETSCDFYSSPPFNFETFDHAKYCKLEVLENRILYLSAWVGVDDSFGWTANSIMEVLGPRYGLIK